MFLSMVYVVLVIHDQCFSTSRIGPYLTATMHMPGIDNTVDATNATTASRSTRAVKPILQLQVPYHDWVYLVSVSFPNAVSNIVQAP